MGNQVVRAGQSALARREGAGLGGGLPRRVVRAVDQSGHQALVASARIQAAEYVAHSAMNSVASVTREEAFHIGSDPMAEHRYRAIADTFAGLAVREIAEMGL